MIRRFPWAELAFLLVVAVIIHLHLHYLILVITALVLIFRGLFWLCERYPRTMLVVLAIVRGLLRR
jgi:hypothetical protein